MLKGAGLIWRFFFFALLLHAPGACPQPSEPARLLTEGQAERPPKILIAGRVAACPIMVGGTRHNPGPAALSGVSHSGGPEAPGEPGAPGPLLSSHSTGPGSRWPVIRVDRAACSAGPGRRGPGRSVTLRV
jgi:hypothetical protein